MKIGWYSMSANQEQGECLDEKRNVKCFCKTYKVKNQQNDENILNKLKWNRLENVVTIYDYCFHDNSVFIFMELCQDTLTSYFQKLLAQQKQKSIALQFFQDLILQVSSGYLELKKLEILHRDIKPNINKSKSQYITFWQLTIMLKSLIKFVILTSAPPKSKDKIQKDNKIYDSKYSYSADMFSFGLTISQMLGCSFNSDQKAINKLFEKLKQKNFKEIIKEDENKVYYKITGEELEQIIEVLNKMIVFQPQERISWEDLNEACKGENINLKRSQNNDQNFKIPMYQQANKVTIQDNNLKISQQNTKPIQQSNHFHSIENFSNLIYSIQPFPPSVKNANYQYNQPSPQQYQNQKQMTQPTDQRIEAISQIQTSRQNPHQMQFQQNFDQIHQNKRGVSQVTNQLKNLQHQASMTNFIEHQKNIPQIQDNKHYNQIGQQNSKWFLDNYLPVEQKINNRPWSVNKK